MGLPPLIHCAIPACAAGLFLKREKTSSVHMTDLHFSMVDVATGLADLFGFSMLVLYKRLT